MKTASEIEYFFVSQQCLEPDSDLESQPFIDQVVCTGFYKAVKLIADKYNVDYLITRQKLIKIWQAQSVFNLWGICCHAWEGIGWVAAQFILID